MKKVIYIVIGFIVILAVFSGCISLPKTPKHLPNQFWDEEDYSQKIGEAIMDAIKEKDAQALMKLFSPAVGESVPTLSDQAEEFVDFFKGEIVSYDLEHLSATIHADQGIVHACSFARCYVITTESKYSFEFQTYYRYTDNSDMKGLYMLITMEDLELHGKGNREFPKYDDDNIIPGIIFVPYE